MSMNVRIAGTVRSVASGRVMIGGTARRITRAVGYIGGQHRTLFAFASPLSLSIVPSAVSAFGEYAGQYLTTETALATPSGGIGPYTYNWDSGNTPMLASNTFSDFAPAFDVTTTAFSVTVTDALGQTASASGFAQFWPYGASPS